MSEVLNVEIREERGKKRIQRLRESGKTPAILYGHGQENVAISLLTKEIELAIRHGSRMIEFAGGLNESALISEVQWDAFGTGLLHLDFTRVSADERVSTSVTIELVGDAPGAHGGGIVEHLMHKLDIECLASSIPDKITVKVNELQVGQTITVGDLDLSDSVTYSVDASKPVVSCSLPGAGKDDVEEAAAADGAEPEVIGRKEETEDA